MAGWGTSWGTGWGGTSKKLVGLVLTGSVTLDSTATTIIAGNYTAAGKVTFDSIDTLTAETSGGLQLGSITLNAIATLTTVVRQSDFTPKIIVPSTKLLFQPKIVILSELSLKPKTTVPK